MLQVLAIQGDLVEAVKNLQKALELNPDERVGSLPPQTCTLPTDA